MKEIYIGMYLVGIVHGYILRSWLLMKYTGEVGGQYGSREDPKNEF
jgi:hypothetical protein